MGPAGGTSGACNHSAPGNLPSRLALLPDGFGVVRMELKDIFAMRPKEETSDAYGEALRAAALTLQNVKARALRLEEERRAALLTGTEEELRKLDTDASSAGLAADRIAALIAEMRVGAVAVAKREAAWAVKVKIEAANAAGEAFRKAFLRDYGPAARKIAELCRQEAAYVALRDHAHGLVSAADEDARQSAPELLYVQKEMFGYWAREVGAAIQLPGLDGSLEPAGAIWKPRARDGVIPRWSPSDADLAAVAAAAARLPSSATGATRAGVEVLEGGRQANVVTSAHDWGRAGLTDHPHMNDPNIPWPGSSY